MTRGGGIRGATGSWQHELLAARWAGTRTVGGGNGVVASVYDALTYLFEFARGEGSLYSTVDPLADTKIPPRRQPTRHLTEEMVDDLW